MEWLVVAVMEYLLFTHVCNKYAQSENKALTCALLLQGSWRVETAPTRNSTPSSPRPRYLFASSRNAPSSVTKTQAWPFLTTVLKRYTCTFHLKQFHCCLWQQTGNVHLQNEAPRLRIVLKYICDSSNRILFLFLSYNTEPHSHWEEQRKQSFLWLSLFLSRFSCSFSRLIKEQTRAQRWAYFPWNTFQRHAVLSLLSSDLVVMLNLNSGKSVRVRLRVQMAMRVVKRPRAELRAVLQAG